MAVERVFRIYWGPTLENVLDFAWPVVGSSPTCWRGPRDGSMQVSNGASTIGWITGRHYRLKVTAQYFAAPQFAGGAGLQAFLDWAADSNAFTLVPNLATPGLQVTGCYLEGPFTKLSVALENDASQTVDLTVLHPTQDLGLAWRGLFFEYAAGGGLTDPVLYTYSRASAGYEINNQGYLTKNPAGTLCDGHYPTPLTVGLQTTLLEPAVTNDVTNPEDLSNASWSKAATTVTVNATKAPDQNFTGDLLVEDGSTGNHLVSANGATCAASDAITALVFIRNGGRFKGWFRMNPNDARAGLDTFGVDYDLHAGTVTTHLQGTGALQSSFITDLANGWSMIWIRGTLNATSTTYRGQVILADATGSVNYTGDATSGAYVWGMTSVHGAGNFVASYTPTTSTKDALQAFRPTAIVPTVPLFIYVKAVEIGAVLAAAAQFPALVTLGTFGAAPNWRTIVDVNNGTANRYSVNEGNSGGSVTSSAPASPAVGQTFELLMQRFADGSVQISIAIAGGAEQPGTRSATIVPGLNAYQTTTIDFGDGADPGYGSDVHQIATVKIGPLAGAGMTLVAARLT